MNYLKIVIGWGGTLIVCLIAAWLITWFPACRRVTVPPGPPQIKVLPSHTNLGLDGTATIADFDLGDIVCYRLGDKELQKATFGYVAGRPGDTISIMEHDILVNGKTLPDSLSGTRLRSRIGNRVPIVVPEGHLFVINDRHKNDSIALGPVPMASVRGRITRWAR